MAVEHFYGGKFGVLVAWNSVTLGYTRDGVQIRNEPKWIDVPSDDYGGTEGVPSDAQFVGAVSHVTLDMTKYEKSALEALSAFVVGGAAGVIGDIGVLIKQELKYAPLVLTGGNEVRTYPIAFLRQAQELNHGTKYRSYRLGFECWINSTVGKTYFTLSS